MKSHLIVGCALSMTLLPFNFISGATMEDWKDKTISPVTNPLFFEDPQITSEIRPIFMRHHIDRDFITQGGNVQVYAVEARWAVTDRFAIIATKDGYIEFNPNKVLKKTEGWADIAAGVKYAVIDNKESQFILTPGLKFELPSGNRRVFQGNGDGEFDVFLSSAKGWDNLHLTGSIGVRLPLDMNEETAQLHYSVMVDYYTCQWFIPFVAANAFTILNDADQLAIGTEGYDLVNFGTSNASGRTQVVLGTGFRSRLLQNFDVGFAYEKSVTHPQGLFDDRFTVDCIFRF